MAIDQDSDNLVERIALLSDSALLKIVGAERAQYREDVITFAEAELEAREISFEDVVRKATISSPAERESETASLEVAERPCLNCGKPVRPGNLYADSELTIVFADNQEERFVTVQACPMCGFVRLMVDYETDVEE